MAFQFLVYMLLSLASVYVALILKECPTDLPPDPWTACPGDGRFSCQRCISGSIEDAVPGHTPPVEGAIPTKRYLTTATARCPQAVDPGYYSWLSQGRHPYPAVLQQGKTDEDSHLWRTMWEVLREKENPCGDNIVGVCAYQINCGETQEAHDIVVSREHGATRTGRARAEGRMVVHGVGSTRTRGRAGAQARPHVQSARMELMDQYYYDAEVEAAREELAWKRLDRERARASRSFHGRQRSKYSAIHD